MSYFSRTLYDALLFKFHKATTISTIQRLGITRNLLQLVGSGPEVAVMIRSALCEADQRGFYYSLSVGKSFCYFKFKGLLGRVLSGMRRTC